MVAIDSAGGGKPRHYECPALSGRRGGPGGRPSRQEQVICLEFERARERVFADMQRQSCSNRISEYVARNDSHVFLSSQHVVVEAALPEPSIDASPASDLEAFGLPRSDDTNKVAPTPETEQQMNVVRHEAISEAPNAMFVANTA